MMEAMTRRYFDAWLKKDIGVLKEVFADDVIYSECYGPEYHGIGQVTQWFSDWNKHARVLEWTIKQFIRQDSMLVAEWYFKCEYDGEVSGFDGNSIIAFDEDGRISSIKEFQSKAEHVYPYGE